MHLLGQSLYHVLDLLFLHQRHSQGRDDTPLEVQDSCCLPFLRVQFHIILALYHNLQGVPASKCMTCALVFSAHACLFFTITWMI